MKEKSNQHSQWKDLAILFSALIGGFLLSFLGFGLLWSGMLWHVQLIMVLPFALLSYVVTRWSKGKIGLCIFIFVGAAPLGILITQFRDNNDSHLMPILIVMGWLLGVILGYFLAKGSLDNQLRSIKNNNSCQ